jgi:hypothetical protein
MKVPFISIASLSNFLVSGTDLSFGDITINMINLIDPMISKSLMEDRQVNINSESLSHISGRMELVLGSLRTLDREPQV